MSAVSVKTLYKVKTGHDSEILVDFVRADGTEFIRLSQFVPSIEHTGMAVMAPTDCLEDLIKALQGAKKTYGNGGGRPGAGQGVLHV